MSYKKALEFLEALPADKRNLICGLYLNANGGRCAIGTLMPELGDALVNRDKKVGLDPFGGNNGDGKANSKRFAQLRYYHSEAWKLVNDGLERLGMAASEATDLQFFNDGMIDVSESERYAKVVEWMRRHA